MFYYFSKLLPNLVYPVGLAFFLLLIGALLKRESTWIRRLNLLALLLLFTGGNRYISTLLLYSLESRFPPLDETPVADVIVVLGGGTYYKSPPRLEYEVNDAGDRLLYAARLYHAGAAQRILVSGGYAKWTGPRIGNETESMSDILQLAGVPAAAILSESESSNTRENAEYSAKLLHQLGVTKIILVTSAFHMPRSAGVFSQFEFHTLPAPTDFAVTDIDYQYLFNLDPRILVLNLIPTADSLNRTTRALKEYLGIVVYGLRGWL
ncbi:MAG: YdcF family protein [Anaerolineae bacterium]|nr:YdcF family protein [Anaerolineae bacterium]